MKKPTITLIALSLLLAVVLMNKEKSPILFGSATVGYTTQGASEYAIASGSNENPAGLKITMSEEGTVTGGSFYGRRTFADKTASVQIYSDVAGERGSLLYTSGNVTLISSSPTLWNVTFSSPVLSAGDYWLQVNIGATGPGTGSGFLNYDTGGGTNTSYTLDDFGAPSYSTNRYSVYLTYTPSSSEQVEHANVQLGGNVVINSNVEIK